MVFAEKKREQGFSYFAHNVIGEITIDSDTKLDKDILDGVIGVLMRQAGGAEIVEGTVRHSNGVVKYSLKRASQWQENEEYDTDEAWNGTHTKTKILENVLHLIPSFMMRIWNWCRRFVVAFQQGLQSANNYPQDIPEDDGKKS